MGRGVTTLPTSANTAVPFSASVTSTYTLKTAGPTRRAVSSAATWRAAAGDPAGICPTTCPLRLAASGMVNRMAIPR
ncbi:MAG: hypothetical protein IPK19_39630 [Chloroflexi bacterium]|nr:hypothetical protein [Chloroflexota bacterium]